MPDHSTDLAWIQLALGRLHERLQAAGADYVEGDARAGIRGAVSGTIEFVQSFTKLSAPANLAPLRAILSALDDVDDGLVPPLFKPAPRGGGRRLDPTDQRQLRGSAAAAMELLMDCLKYGKRDASRAVALRLKKLDIFIGNSRNASIKSAAATVASWRDHASSGNKKSEEDASVFHDFVASFKPLIIEAFQSGTSRETLRDKVLDAFDEVCTVNLRPSLTSAEKSS
jgi:hypothetical protein